MKIIPYNFSKTIRLTGWFLVIFLLLAVSGIVYAPVTIVEVKNPLVQVGQILMGNHNPTLNNHNFNSIIFKTSDGFNLSANIYTCRQAKATIILLHGFRSQKEQWHQTALWLNQKGYNAVALDLRGHGQSEGEYCSFGYYEKKDVSTLINFLQTKSLQEPFGIWGHSLGGAVALQTMANDNRIKFGIIESSYADFPEIVKDYANYYVPFAPDFLNNWWLSLAADKARFPIEAISPLKAAKQINQPVLMIHGLSDKKINANNTRRIYKVLKSKDKNIILVPKADHYNVHQIGGEWFYKEVAIFLDHHI